MTLSTFTPVAVSTGTPSLFVGLTHRELEDEVTVLPLREDGAISHDFLVAAPSQVIPLRLWVPIDDGHPMLMRVAAMHLSDAPGGEIKLKLAGYRVMYVPPEYVSSAPGTIVVARTYVTEVVDGAVAVQGLNMPVDIATLIGPKELADELERKKAC